MTATDWDLDRVRRHLAANGAASLCRFKARYLERRLQSRCRHRGAADLSAYADLLDQDPEEVGRLVSAVALGVTSFFRNPSAWRRLASLLASAAPAGQPCRAWSAGCATGEEAWSLALLLEDQLRGGRVSGWEVDATDLDPRNLAVARHGEYSDRARADIEAVLAGAPDSEPPGRFVVPEVLRRSVRFAMTDLTVPTARGPYDVVLCRNVLMYFEAETQRDVMDVVLSAVRPGGLLMLGKAELAGFDLFPRLESVDRPERIYRRAA